MKNDQLTLYHLCSKNMLNQILPDLSQSNFLALSSVNKDLRNILFGSNKEITIKMSIDSAEFIIREIIKNIRNKKKVQAFLNLDFKNYSLLSDNAINVFNRLVKILKLTDINYHTTISQTNFLPLYDQNPSAFTSLTLYDVDNWHVILKLPELKKLSNAN